MRRTSALVSSAAVVAVLSAGLAGCAASPDDVSACTPLLASGDASSLVTATGELGTEPEVEVPAPLVSQTGQRTVLEKGEGLVAKVGMTVDFDFTAYDGKTGTKIGATAYAPAAAAARMRADGKISATQEAPSPLARALVCAQPEQRFVVTAPAADFAELNLAQFGIAEQQTVIVVADVRNVFLGKADGVNQLPQDGMPVVVTAPDGTVGLTIPSGLTAPSVTRIETVKLGSGAKLREGDKVVVGRAVWAWPTDGSELSQAESTWEPGRSPATLELTEDPTGAKGVSPALYRALLGAPVGSQLLVVVAPDDNYTEANALPSGTTADDTLIYVIDVLGIEPSADTPK